MVSNFVSGRFLPPAQYVAVWLTKTMRFGIAHKFFFVSRNVVVAIKIGNPWLVFLMNYM